MVMALKVSLSDQGVNVAPEKLYTQSEVDFLVSRKKVSIDSLSESGLIDQPIERNNVSDKKVMAGLVKKSNRILLSISSHAFPIDFFPDSINVEESRVTIINRHFLSSEVHSIDIKNISNIFINTSIFFSQLVIISKTFEENEIKMGHLRTEEAILVRRIIEGLRVFDKNKINTSNYSEAELIIKLKELSKTEIVM